MPSHRYYAIYVVRRLKKLTFKFSIDFISSGSPAIQDCGIISGKSYCSSKCTFKKQINFSHQKKSWKSRGTLPGVPRMSCWKSFMRLLTF